MFFFIFYFGHFNLYDVLNTFLEKWYGILVNHSITLNKKPERNLGEVLQIFQLLYMLSTIKCLRLVADCLHGK